MIRLFGTLSILFFVFSSSLIPCSDSLARQYDKTSAGAQELHLALVPEKNVFEQKRRYRYITEYLSKNLNTAIKIDIMSSYGKISDAFTEGSADMGFFGSFSYVLTNAKAHVEPVARPVWPDGSSTYSGYIFVRKDSAIQSVKDMRNKCLVLVDKATTAGYVFQLAYFKNHGITNLDGFFSDIYYAGSHDASAWAVYIGEADVGGGKNHIFNALAKEYPDFKHKMAVLAESPQVPSNGLAVRKDLDPTLKLHLRDLLLNLDATKEGRQVLKQFGARKFIATKDEDYDSLYKMVKDLNIDLKSYPY